VFRFPKSADVWSDLDREIAFLAYASSRLPVRVPQYIFVRHPERSEGSAVRRHSERSEESAPRRHSERSEESAVRSGFAVYEYLRGTSLTAPDLSPTVGQQVANLLRALHRLEPPPDVDALLPREDPRAAVDEYRAGIDGVSLHLSREQRAALDRVFDDYTGDPRSFHFTPRVLHADFSAEHILSDGAGKITGIIDWGDVSWGDPDYDFAYLYADFGLPFVRDVARAYGHANIDALAAKLRYFAVVDQIDTIALSAGRALPGQVDAAVARLRELLDQPATAGPYHI